MSSAALGYSAIPILTVGLIIVLSSTLTSISLIFFLNLSAIVTAFKAAVSGRIMVNSSPPYLEGISTCLIVFWIVAAISFSTISPTR